MTEHLADTVKALSEKILHDAPEDSKRALVQGSLHLMLAQFIERNLDSLPERQAAEMMILDFLRIGMRTAIPTIGSEFRKELRSDIQELAVELMRMADAAEAVGLGPFQHGENAADRLGDIVREITDTQLSRMPILAGSVSGTVLDIACDLLRERCVRCVTFE